MKPSRIRFDPPRGRRRLLTAALVALPLLTIVALVIFREPAREPGIARTPVGVPSDAAPNLSAPSSETVSTGTPTLDGRAAASQPVDGGARDRCAAATASTPVTGDPATRRAAARESRNRALNRLRGLGDDRSLAWSMLRDRDNHAATSGELARLAHRSADPSVLAMALTRCENLPDPACRGLDVQTWLTRNPADPRPWLWTAYLALRRDDEAAAEAALQRALAMPWPQGGSPTDTAVDLPAGDDETLIQRWRQLTDTVEIDDHVNAAVTGAAALACERLHRPDGERIVRPAARALPGCRALADRMAASPRLAERHLALNLGELVGWRAERVETAREEVQALQLYMMEDMRLSTEISDCADLRQRFLHWRSTWLEGDIATAERHMKANGLSLPALIERARAADTSTQVPR